VYETQADERLDPKKLIFGGENILSIKRDRINKTTFLN